jgi:histidine kinase
MTVKPLQREKDDIFEVVLNTVSEGITVIDKDLRIQFQNKVITQVYGSSMIGKHCFKAYRNRKEPCEDCKILDVLKDGQHRRIIRDISLPNGDVLLVELNSAPIKDAEGNIIGAVEVARDVTEQKKAEALLNRTLLKQNVVFFVTHRSSPAKKSLTMISPSWKSLLNEGLNGAVTFQIRQI